MIWNEFRKIWNWKILLMILLVGSILFYDWVMGQMNLKYLPVWETVDLEVSADLVKKYGKTIDGTKAGEIQALLDENRQIMEEKKKQAIWSHMSEIQSFGYETYEEMTEDLDRFYEQENIGEDREKLERYEKIDTLYFEINEAFEWETHIEENYLSLLDAMGFFNEEDVLLEFDSNYSMDEGGGVSLLPGTMISNLGFVIQEYGRIIMLLTLLLVFPYLAMDNRTGAYPLAATTKVGRGILKKQIGVMIFSELILLFVFSLAFICAYSTMTPYYGLLADCLVPGLPFTITLKQYIIVLLVCIALGALALSMIFFVISSFVRNIVGIVVAALPCLGIGTAISIWFYPNLFRMDYAGKAGGLFSSGSPYFTIMVMLAEIVLGIILLALVYRRRMKEDILE